MLKDRENILNALREKPLKAYQLMRRANLPNEEACQSLLLKMRDEGLVKFDIHKGLREIRLRDYRSMKRLSEPVSAKGEILLRTPGTPSIFF